MLFWLLASCTPVTPVPTAVVESTPAAAPTQPPTPTVLPTDPCAGRMLPIRSALAPFDATTAAADNMDHLLALACTFEVTDPLQASQFAQEAASRPDSPAAAHFLLARTLARVRVDHGRICDTGAYSSVILDQLLLAAAEPGYAAAAENPVFAEFRTNVRYRVATGRPYKGPGALAAIAEGLEIYAPAAGVYGSQERLTLAPGGLLQRQVLAFDENGMPTRVSKDLPKGWSVDGESLVIDTGGGPVHVSITPDFRFVTPTGDLLWVDSDSECEA